MIGQICIILMMILLFGWLSRLLFRKKKHLIALLTGLLTVGSVVMLFDPETYADDEKAKTEQTAKTSSSTSEKEETSASKTDESKIAESKEKEEQAKKEKQQKEEQAKKEAAKKAAAKKKAAEAKKRQQEKQAKEKAQVTSLPSYQGQPYAVINDNQPYFAAGDGKKEFETYAPLDDLGRCGVAYANLSRSTMPTGKRQSIGSVKPSGWQTVRYSNVDGKYLYNRCHLIGYQLAAENANERNLITGTRYLNVDGMLPFENMVADYIKSTGNHVLYRVTPHFEGNNLVASGVQIEAKSVEDNGKGILFNVYCFNVQPGVKIDYADGSSQLTDSSAHELSSKTTSRQSAGNAGNTTASSTASSTATAPATSSGVVRGNSRSKIYHMPGQRDYDNMADSKYLVVFSSPEEAQAQGYRQAKR